MIATAFSRAAERDEEFPYVWADNWAALVGVVICSALLLLWKERNNIELRSGKRDWENQ